jgi:protein-disulfide isomerase
LPFLVLFVVLFGFLVAPPAATAADSGLDALMADRVLGDPNAPVTIEEYSSLTCPHCGHFHREILPQIRSTYIDTGEVKLIYRDFPLDGRALAAAMIARCVKPSRYYGFIDTLYFEQEAWSTRSDPLLVLKRWANVAGLSDKEVDACLNDQALADAIQAHRAAAAKDRGIDSTPTFFVDGQLIRGAAPYEDFAAAIDAAFSRSNSPEKTEAPAAGDDPSATAQAPAAGR